MAPDTPNARSAPVEPDALLDHRDSNRLVARGVTPTDPPGVAPSARRWFLLALLTSAYAAGAFGVLGVPPLSPALLDGFRLTRFQVGLILPAIYVGGIVFSLPGGRLADRYGVRASLTFGLALVGIGLLAASVVPVFVAFLGCLLIVSVGWSVVNPALGKAIIEVFPIAERGLAMGVKQMGLMVGGILAALVLPSIALAAGWRVALLTSAVVVTVTVGIAWRWLPAATSSARATAREAHVTSDAWWWLGRPALVVFLATGIGLGMVQSVVLAYMTLYAIQALGYGPVGAGALLAVAQVGGAVSRVAFGVMSDRWLGGRRSPLLILTAAVTAAVFVLYAWRPSSAPVVAGIVAFLAGVGTFGWVGLYFVVCAEVGGVRQAGLLTGVGFACIVSGIFVGAPSFGAILQATDSYAAAWAVFAVVAAITTVALAAVATPLHRESRARTGALA